MSRRFQCVRSRARSRGVGLVTAIFLLVVLAALGVGMFTVFTSQQATSVLDERGARAYQAARAGVEWALFQQLRNDSCTSSTTFDMPSTSVLSGFSVTVTCTRIGDPGDPLKRFVIRSSACSMRVSGTCDTPSSHPDYVRRVLEVEI